MRVVKGIVAAMTFLFVSPMLMADANKVESTKIDRDFSKECSGPSHEGKVRVGADGKAQPAYQSAADMLTPEWLREKPQLKTNEKESVDCENKK